MKVRRIARLMAIVLTLVTMISCLAIVATFNTSGITKTANYVIIPGSEMASANERHQVTTISTTGGVWKFKTTGNDPYVNTAAISGVGDTVLRTYPYVVVRYKCSTFTSMEIFCGHPNTAARRVSMPAPETNGQWGCLFYDFSPFPNEYKSWFRLEMATASDIEMEIAEVVLFKNTADVTAYHSVYVGAGAGGCEVLTFNDMGYHGNGVTGRTGNSGDVSGVTEVRPDSNTAMFNEGGYFTRLTSGGNDGWLEFKQNNGAATNGVKNFGKVAVRYRTTSSYNGRTMQLFFAVNGAYSEGNSSKATIKGDDSWQWAFFTNPLKGSANSLRFDYMTGTGHVDVAEIYFYNNTADVYSASVGAASRRNVANSTWFHSGMYFLHRDSYTYFEHSDNVSKISTGSLAGNYRENQTANFRYGSQTRSVVGRTFYYVAGTHSAHTANSGTVTVQATCTTAGTTRYNCTACNDVTSTNTSLPAALGHNTSGSVTHKDATCTATGIVGGTYCTRCNNGKTAAEASIAALGHNKEGSVAHKDPTCTATGVVGGTYCARCNDGKAAVEEVIAALGHNSDGTVTHKDPTCTATGVVGGTYCARCNDGKAAVEEVIAALGHDEKVDAAKAPTCTATGLEEGKHCDRCKEILLAQAIIAALGHDEKVDAAVAPYCTTTGLTEGKHCDRCAETLIKQNVVDALGHDEKIDAAVAPYCTTTGKTEGKHCDRCSEILLAQNVIDALGHDEKVDAAVAPTCTATGLEEGKHCDRCKETLLVQAIIAALGHAEVVDAAVEPDCTTTGLTEGCHCSRCEEVFTAQQIIAALGHNEVIDAAVSADCTNAGKTAGSHCARCTTVLVAQNIIAALGHDSDVVVVISTATCTAAGCTEYSCSRCAELQSTEETPALGHDEKAVAETKPTYTTVGYTAGTMCDRCKEALGGGEVIDKLNPLLTYNVALGERFAVNMKYVAFAGATIKVVDEEGTEYAFTVTENVGTHTDGLAIYSIRIADISARNLGHVFTVIEEASGYSTGVSVKGYCDQVDALYGDKTEEEIAADFVAAGYDEVVAQALATKTVLAHTTTVKMDIYGMAAVNYFAPAGADHDGLKTVIGADYVATDASRTVNNTGDVIFKGASVVFGDEVELLFKMQNYRNEKIYVNGVEVPESEISSHLSTDGTYVYFSIFVTPDEFSTAFTVRAGSHVLGESGYYGNSSYIIYSVDTYITSMQKKYATDESEKGKSTMNLVNALGHYGESAIAYKEG